MCLLSVNSTEQNSSCAPMSSFALLTYPHSPLGVDEVAAVRKALDTYRQRRLSSVIEDDLLHINAPELPDYLFTALDPFAQGIVVL
jgi:hypothetical protein